MCCLPLQSLRGPINTTQLTQPGTDQAGPNLTTPSEIHQRQQDETKTGEAIIPATNNKHHIRDKIFLTVQNNVPSVFAVIYL